MPTYEYACGTCGHEWEEVQRITAPPIEVCPKCAKASAHRLVSGGTNFILKGGGWYSDLYASSGASKNADGGGGGSSDGASKSSGTTEKAADKSETKATPKTDGGSTTPSAPSTASS
jgi:putative FmdB family regulatory protein